MRLAFWVLNWFCSVKHGFDFEENLDLSLIFSLLMISNCCFYLFSGLKSGLGLFVYSRMDLATVFKIGSSSAFQIQQSSMLLN